MLVQIKVLKVAVDRRHKMPVVILQEANGERVLPILIGPGEAQAIATQLEEMKFARPLTHDLLVAVVAGLGGSLQKVVISRVEGGTYYAELLIDCKGEMITVDARPSDSIAVALRAGAQIFAQDGLLESIVIEIADEHMIDFEASPPSFDEAMGPEQLKEHLRQLNPEDFGRFTP
ncbi:MAG: bifunctional nuclease family protein [Gemmatimonadota bacterium]|nr:MAG: bifunctional nuclease family protein [Gemmatimonadota bacterium]